MLVNGFVTLVARNDNSQKNSVTVHLSGFRPLFSFTPMEGRAENCSCIFCTPAVHGGRMVREARDKVRPKVERVAWAMAGAVRDQNELRDVSVSEQVLHEASSEDSTVSSGSTLCDQNPA